MPTPPQLPSGTYEVIRNRLQNQAEALQQRLEKLNQSRKEVFGNVEKKLLANSRIHTDNYCTPRDILALGRHFIFGYNVHIGLRSGIRLADVFSVYRLEGDHFQEAPLTLLENEKFFTDFQNLYRYYRDALFARFVRQEAYLYMIFQVSDKVEDIKAFKWLVLEEGLRYIDARSEKEVRTPRQYEFRWQRAGRDAQRNGRHPHISILDRLFVEAIGGDLTIKVEDNTDDGQGIYREEVEYKDQALDDGEYWYAALGNLIALKIRPYQEPYRHFIFNEKMQQVQPIAALADSGVLLPEGHGLIFANGYYLQTGEYKFFNHGLSEAQFERRLSSPNGEDYLYAFYNHARGAYVLLHYNLITQEVETPIICHGFSLFDDGLLCYFRAEEEPGKHHLVQLWQTPFSKGEQLPQSNQSSYLFKVGNKDIVRAMADVREAITLAYREDSYEGLYDDLERKCTEIRDRYYWLGHAEAFRLDEPLQQLQATAEAAIAEFEKKQKQQQATAEATARVQREAATLMRKARQQTAGEIGEFVQLLAALRALRGEAISLKGLPYAEVGLIEELEEKIGKHSDGLAEACVAFLLEEDALAPYRQRMEAAAAAAAGVETAVQAREQEQQIDAISAELQLLIDIVSSLQIEDATQASQVIDNISALFAGLNQSKAAIRQKGRELQSREAGAEFHAQLKLLEQTAINYLGLAESPEQSASLLSRLIAQMEELEGKFAEYDEFIEKLGEKREALYTAFENRRKQLLEARNNRSAALQRTAGRLLDGIQSRSLNLGSAGEINGFFASDLLVDKVRNLTARLREMEETNKAAAIHARLQSLKEEALRQLQDRQELFVDGEDIIRLGRHAFEINTQPLELSIVQRDGHLFYHLTGTDFYEQVDDETLLENRRLWEQNLVSENEEVYRAEYLAYQLWREGAGKALLEELLPEDAPNPHPELLKQVRESAARRYEEGYTRGVHDEDAARILQALLLMEQRLGMLRFPPDARALAQLAWFRLLPEAARAGLHNQIRGIGALLQAFPGTHEFDYLVEEIREEIIKASGLVGKSL